MTRTGRVGVGVIGAGVISGTYLENMTAFADLEVQIGRASCRERV